MTPQHFTDLDHELAVGSAPTSAEEIEGLAAAGVRAVVNLQSDADLRARGLHWPTLWQLYTRAGIEVTRVPIVDFDRKDLGRRLDDAVAAVQAHLEAGRKVYVHCSAGLNRSPTTVIATLVVRQGWDLRRATRWLTERHEAAPYPRVLEAWAKRHGYPMG